MLKMKNQNEFLEQFNSKSLSKDLLKNNILIFSKDHWTF